MRVHPSLKPPEAFLSLWNQVSGALGLLGFPLLLLTLLGGGAASQNLGSKPDPIRSCFRGTF